MQIKIFFASIFFALYQFSVAQDKPNIIVILSDDMGFSDLGCYGGEIYTPNLDKLASNGLRFTQFYNTARCCPTRASLLTGLYAHQTGIGLMTDDDNLPGYRGELGRNAVTIAEVLKPAGYNTYMVGKWHVTNDTNWQKSKSNWPLQRGFDRFYGTINGAGSYWDPGTLSRDNTFVSPFADPMYKPSTYYYTDAISDNAVMFINENKSQKPFFMYVAYTAAHWPLHAPEKDAAKYKGMYDKGYAAIREERFKRVKALGLVNESCKLSETTGSWEQQPDKEWEARCMEVYAAQIDVMDQGIGRIVDVLKKNGQYDNTLILYLQDNGACHTPHGRDPKGPRVERGKPSMPMSAEETQFDGLPEKNKSRLLYPTWTCNARPR